MVVDVFCLELIGDCWSLLVHALLVKGHYEVIHIPGCNSCMLDAINMLIYTGSAYTDDVQFA